MPSKDPKPSLVDSNGTIVEKRMNHLLGVLCTVKNTKQLRDIMLVCSNRIKDVTKQQNRASAASFLLNDYVSFTISRGKYVGSYEGKITKLVRGGVKAVVRVTKVNCDGPLAREQLGRSWRLMFKELRRVNGSPQDSPPLVVSIQPPEWRSAVCAIPLATLGGYASSLIGALAGGGEGFIQSAASMFARELYESLEQEERQKILAREVKIGEDDELLDEITRLGFDLYNTRILGNE